MDQDHRCIGSTTVRLWSSRAFQVALLTCENVCWPTLCVAMVRNGLSINDKWKNTTGQIFHSQTIYSWLAFTTQTQDQHQKHGHSIIIEIPPTLRPLHYSLTCTVITWHQVVTMAKLFAMYGYRIMITIQEGKSCNDVQVSQFSNRINMIVSY